MGTNLVPKYAYLFVGYVEENMLLTYNGTMPIMLRIYIDDYIGISTSTKNEHDDFMQYVNDFHPSFSYTYDMSDNSVNFLDISISMTQHGLTTDIFYKDTDTHSCHRHESAHPPSCKKVIPYSQLLRLRRISNNDHNLERRSDEMSEFFSQRGFPVNTIKNSLRMASKFKQSEASNKRKNLNNTGVPLTMKFSGIDKYIAKTIHSNLIILSANHKTNRIFGTKIYFRETKRRLADGFTEHLRSIKLNFPGLPVAAHLSSSGHSIFNAIVSVVTSCINDINRKTEEERLICNLGTLQPRGINDRLYSCPVSIVTP